MRATSQLLQSLIMNSETCWHNEYMKNLDNWFLNPKGNVVLYHGDCNDGLVAAWVIDQYMLRMKQHYTKTEFIPMDYPANGEDNLPYPKLVNKNVIFVDFSCKYFAMEKLINVAEHILVIDHHATSFADLAPLFKNKIIEGIITPERSGCVLTWMWFFRDVIIPHFLLYVEDRDIWKFELEHTREITSAFWYRERSFASVSSIVGHWISEKLKLISEGELVLRIQTRDKSDAIKNHTELEVFDPVSGQNVCIKTAYTTRGIGSDVAYSLAERSPVRIGGYLYMKKGRLFLSLRSTEDGPDVSKIAEWYGGGGHKHAASFCFDERFMYSNTFEGGDNS